MLRLAVSELRLSLFQECLDAFFAVLSLGNVSKQPRLECESVIKRTSVPLFNGLERQPDCHKALGRDLPRQILGHFEDLILRDHLIDES